MNDQNRAIPVGNYPSSPIGEGGAQSNALTLFGRNTSNSANIPSAASNVPQNIFVTPVTQPTSVINLTDSSEVVIGPMTQYQDPVILYQYMDATVDTRSMHANEAIRQHSTVEDTKRLTRTNRLILIVLVLIIINSVGLGVFIVLQNRDNSSDKREPILFGNNYETGSFQNLGNGHLVIDRDQWGASAEYNISHELEHPIPYVLVTHVGVQASPCYNIYECSIKMQSFQNSAVIEQNLTDINSNFYVAHDGNVYEGRGWNVANTYANKSLAVTFIGDYIRYKPNGKQLEAIEYLLAFGVTNNYLATDYKLIAQNQTKYTRSPGTNVYEEIYKWPHWHPCNKKDNPCGAEIGLPRIWDARQ